MLKNKITFFLFILVTGFCVNLYAAGNDILILKSEDYSQYDVAIDGFKRQIRKQNSQYNFPTYLLENVKSTLVNDIASDSPKIVLAVGSTAADFCKENIKNIPVVFCMVLDPKEHSLTTAENIAGVSLNIPYPQWVQAIIDAVPNVRSVGIIYSPEANEENVQKAKDAADLLGIKLVTSKVYARGDITSSFNDIIGKVDVMWIIVDPVVCTAYSIKYLLMNTLQRRIPLVGISREYVKAGAMLAVTPDYIDIGVQAADMVSEIISGNVAVSALKIENPRSSRVVLNMRTADSIGIKVPSQVERNAAEIF